MGAVPGAGLLWGAGFELWAVADAPAKSATRAKVAKRPAQRRGEETGVKFVKSIFLAWGACARVGSLKVRAETVRRFQGYTGRGADGLLEGFYAVRRRLNVRQ
jgi:hypothetical protein